VLILDYRGQRHTVTVAPTHSGGLLGEIADELLGRRRRRAAVMGSIQQKKQVLAQSTNHTKRK